MKEQQLRQFFENWLGQLGMAQLVVRGQGMVVPFSRLRRVYRQAG